MDVPTRPQQYSRRDFHRLNLLAGCTALATFNGCGTLLYPERIGQSRSGPIDWGVVGMDSIGLLFFFVPGVIAFAIDIYNGTLFHTAQHAPVTGETKFTKVQLSRRFPKHGEIAAAISKATGQRITLEEGTYLTRPLKSLEEFPLVENEYVAAYGKGELIYRCQSPE